MDITLIPGGKGRHCPGNPEHCDECDYLICCSNYSGLCEKCFADIGKCPLRNNTGEYHSPPEITFF